MFYINLLACPVSSFSNMSKLIPNCLINWHIMATATFGLSVSVGISHLLVSIRCLLDAMVVDVVKLQVPTQVQADTGASWDTDSTGRRVWEFQGCQGRSSIWVFFWLFQFGVTSGKCEGCIWASLGSLERSKDMKSWHLLGDRYKFFQRTSHL